MENGVDYGVGGSEIQKFNKIYILNWGILYRKTSLSCSNIIGGKLLFSFYQHVNWQCSWNFFIL